jgi:hypothetical protein
MSSLPQALNQATAWHFLSGPVRLCVSAADFPHGEPPCAAEAAVVLDLAGDLLDALAAAGLVADAPWQWVAHATPAGGAQARWRHADSNVDTQVRLSLPWPALRALAEAPDVPGLQWQPTPAECVLAQWHLADDELAALEPGGLLLLEDAAAHRLRARGEATAGEPPWQLVSRWEQPLPLDLVLGWRGPVPAAPVQCQLIETARPDVVRARGRLVPWGSGQAFRIETL